MPNLARLPTWAENELVHVVVETPRGARAKLTFDPELKQELEKFFVATDELEAKTLKFLAGRDQRRRKSWSDVAKRFSRKGIRVLPTTYPADRECPVAYRNPPAFV